MANTLRLTEKRMANRRFRESEESILARISNLDESVDTKTVTQEIGISRATFYRHHQRLCEIIPDYRKLILRRYNRMILRLGDNELSLEELIKKVLLFIIMNKKYFLVFMRKKDRRMLEMMLGKIRGRVEKCCNLPKNDDKVYMVYVGEISKIIEWWGMGGFREEEFMRTAHDIMFLSDTLWKRLGELEK